MQGGGRWLLLSSLPAAVSSLSLLATCQLTLLSHAIQGFGGRVGDALEFIIGGLVDLCQTGYMVGSV